MVAGGCDSPRPFPGDRGPVSAACLCSWPVTVEPEPVPNPWRTTGSRDVYANPWIEVREDAVVRADGSSGIYGVVSMRNFALGVAPLLHDGSTILVGQHRYTLGRWSWEVPTGGGAKDRPVEEEVARELVEETGVRARRLEFLGELHTSNSVTDEQGLLYLARDCEEGEAVTDDPTERLARWRLPFAAAVEMARDGRITDAMSVALLLRAAHHLRGGAAA